jgi:hypothetical protein
MAKSFDYRYTCPEIDKEIDNFKESLSDHLIDLISELNPMFAETNKEQKYREDWVKIIYDSVEGCFEGVRRANEDMRKEAESQIENLTEELEEAKKLAIYWESEADEKDREILDLKNEMAFE